MLPSVFGDHPLLAEVHAGLTGELVGTHLQVDHTLAHAHLLVRECSSVRFGLLGPHPVSCVAWAGLRLLRETGVLRDGPKLIELGPKFGEIGPKWDKSGTFKTSRFHYILARCASNVLRLILKSH